MLLYAQGTVPCVDENKGVGNPTPKAQITFAKFVKRS